MFEQKPKPYSFEALPEYKMGWNSASAGNLAHQNPFPENAAPLSNWNLWNNGFNDYCKSPYFCKAREWYNGVRKGRLDGDAQPAGTERERHEDEGFVAIRYVFDDGSALVHTDGFVYVESRLGDAFISLPKSQLNVRPLQ